MANRFDSLSAVSQLREMHESTALGALQKQMQELENNLGLRALRKNMLRASEMSRPWVEAARAMHNAAAPWIETARAIAPLVEVARAIRVPRQYLDIVRQISAWTPSKELIEMMDRTRQVAAVYQGSVNEELKRFIAANTWIRDVNWEAVAENARQLSEESLPDEVGPALEEVILIAEAPAIPDQERQKRLLTLWWNLMVLHAKHPLVRLMLSQMLWLIAFAGGGPTLYQLATLPAQLEREAGEHADALWSARLMQVAEFEAEKAKAIEDEVRLEAAAGLFDCAKRLAPQNVTLTLIDASMRTTRRGHRVIANLPPGTQVFVVCIARRDVYIQAEVGPLQVLTGGWIPKKVLERPRAPFYRGRGTYLLFESSGEE